MDIDQEKLARTSTGQLGLLVSVRDSREALVVEQAGVDVLDVKEPRNGPLGKSEDKVIAEILSSVRSSTIVSIALGDIDDCERYLKSNSIPEGVRLAKCGLALSIHSDWRNRISKVWESIRESCDPVAVAYSDFEQCDAPQPIDIVKLAGQQGVKFLLLDTYLKNGTSSLDLLNEDDSIFLFMCVENVGRDDTVLVHDLRRSPRSL